MGSLTDSRAETTVLAWFAVLGRRIAGGSDMAPGTRGSERGNWRGSGSGGGVPEAGPDRRGRGRLRLESPQGSLEESR